jgi:eukaryotic-like serine/threonine-protein kinase
MIGKLISHYKILEKLGEGGMGVVYKALDTKLDRTVAMKFLPQNVALSETDRKRFIHEAQAASSLEHPNICTIHEIEETSDGQLFIVMPAYEGTPLNKKIEHGPLSINEAIDIAMQIADGLQAAHEKGIVHRDIKSSNIFITQKGQVKIVDFGLARGVGMTQVTKTGMTMGTVPYMSPEQAHGKKVDHRTDIWSFGVILYEMITGRMPFEGEYNEAIVYQILNEEPEPVTSLRSNVPIELERIVKKAMDKGCSTRYQTVGDTLADLRRLMKEIESGVRIEVAEKKSRPFRKSMYIYGGIVVLVLIIVAVRLYVLPGKPEVIDSIAVLPLENLMGDPEQEYFVDGMHEALIIELSKISALKVISRTSAMQYKGVKKPMPQIARELDVKLLIEGSVLREGDHVRITVQLIHGLTDRHLWAQSFDRELRGILALQGEVARSIVHEIQLKLTPQEQTRMSGPHQSVNPQAYEAYLRGLYHANKRTKEDLEKSLDYFQQALHIDPDYAPAYAGLADSYTILGSYGFITPEEAFPKAKAAALQGLQMDEQLVEPHVSLANTRLYEWDWVGAEKEFRRAIELNPGYSTGRHWYALYLAWIGRIPEALVEIQRARELDPLSTIINTNVGWIYYFARQNERAEEYFHKALELDPNFPSAYWKLGKLYLQKSMYDKAIAEFRKLLTSQGQDPHSPSALIAQAYALAGKTDEAIVVINQVKAEYETGYLASVEIALAYALLQKKEEAFIYLEKSYEEQNSSLMWVNVDPLFDPLRDDPRFQDLLKRMNFPKY